MKESHEKAIRAFAGEERRIYLHGSRRMYEKYSGDAETDFSLEPDTDYDYAVPYLEGWELGKAFVQGWTECKVKSYTDANTATVLEGYIDGDKVQVSSRTHLPTYIKIFENIEPEYYFNHLRKDKEKMRDYLARQYEKLNNDIFNDLPF